MTSGTIPTSATPGRINLLGPLQVLRPDHTVVGIAEWRTSKTVDLLRMLALRSGSPIGSAQVIDALWSSVEPARARASLRTAACQIRHVLGKSSIARSAAGLTLHDVTVDAIEFRNMTRLVHRLNVEGDNRAALDCTERADVLYRGDLAASDPLAEWAVFERDALAKTHRSLLIAGAEAALQCRRFAEAEEYAQRSVDLDPFSERAYRLLMRARAALGEVSGAVRDYERCRRTLAAELGIDPSAQTHELYLTLLRTPAYV